MLSYKILLLITLFCAFFSVNSSPVNPVYPIGALIILISILSDIYQGKINKKIFPFILFFLTLLSLQSLAFINNKFGEKTMLSILLFLYTILLALPTFSFATKLNSENRKKIYKVAYDLLIIFLFIELVVRILNSGLSINSFYDMKKGFFYLDSNFTGLVIMNFLFFLKFLEQSDLKIKLGSRYFILWVFLIFTFSRSAIISALFLTFFYRRSTNIKTRSILIISISLIAPVILLLIYLAGQSFTEIDGSFNSKFYIFSESIDLYSSYFTNENKIFGIGLGNLKPILGIFAHNITVTFILEFGLLGTFTIFIFFYYVLKKTKWKAAIIITPNLMSGFSLFSAYTPFLFILLALIIVETQKSEGNPSLNH